MATPPSATAAVSASPSPAVSAVPPGIKPPNPDVHRPVTPPPPHNHHHHHHLTSHDVLPSSKYFGISAVAILRAVAIAFATVHLIMECAGRRQYNFAASLFVTIATLQLLWLIYALLTELGLPSAPGGRGERRKGLTVDLGFVQCIFGRRGYEAEDAGGGAVLRLVPGGGDRRKKRAGGGGRGGGRVLLLYTAVDVVFVTVTLTIAVLSLENSGRMWYWERHFGIGVMGLVVAAHEVAIAISQHLSIMRRTKIGVLCEEDEDEDDGDEEGNNDLGSPKYRIRLPQSPEHRRAAMSVAA